MNRRGFLQSILAAGVMPAIVRAESIMAVSGLSIPTRAIILPNQGLIVPDAALAVGRVLTVGLHSAGYRDALADGLIEVRREISPSGFEQAVFAMERRLPRYVDENEAIFRRLAKDMDRQYLASGRRRQKASA